MTGWRVPLTEILAEDTRQPSGAWLWPTEFRHLEDRCEGCGQITYRCECWANLGGDGELV